MLVHQAWKWRSLLCVCVLLCLTLCDPMHHGLPGFSVCGFFQARMLMWVAVSYSRRSLQTPHFSSSSSAPPPLFFSSPRLVCGAFLCLKFSSSYRDPIKVTVLSHSIVSDSLQSFVLQPASLLCPWDFPGRNTRVSCHFPPPGYLPNLGIKRMSPVSPALQADSLPAEPSGKCIKEIRVRLLWSWPYPLR